MVRGGRGGRGDSMLGLILDLKNHLEAVFGIIALIATAWRFVIRPVWTRVQRIDAAIGSNGGSNLFEQMETIKDMLHIHASLADVIDRPSLFLSSEGEVDTVNVAFTERTGWSKDTLSRGGWRQLFARDDQDDWDEVVARRAVFRRVVTLGHLTFLLVAQPVFNGEKFLGWRAVLTPKEQPRRRMTDQPS